VSRLEVATETTWGVGALLKAFLIVVLPMVASALPTPAASGPPSASAAAAPNPAGGAADDISLANLGIATQTVRGPDASVAVLFPPPGRDLANTGSFIRVTFEHSVDAGPGATLDIAVNGHRLTSVPMTEETATGSVIEVPTPGTDLFPDQPNLFEARFSFPAHREGTGSSASVPFGRIDGETLVHYQLRDPAATLAAYPFSLATGDPRSPLRLGLVVPTAPTGGEVSAAFRLAADVGARLWTRPVVPDVVAARQQAWLEAGAGPALVVGRIDRLALIPSLLARAGLRRTHGTWTVTGSGQAAGPEDGVLAELAPSASLSQPVIVVTGASDAAVERAAAALVAAPEGVPVGGVALVRRPPRPTRLRPSGPITVRQALRGGGEDHLAIPVPAASAPGGQGRTLRLAMSAPDGGCGRASASIDVDGRRAASATLSANSSAPALQLPAGLLGNRPNVVLLRVSCSAGQEATPVAPVELSATMGPATEPAPAGTPPGLQWLPYPFLGAGSAPLTVVLGRGDGPTLEAGARTLVWLARLAPDRPPPRLTVTTPVRGRTTAVAASNLLIVGHPAAGGSPVSSLELGIGDLEVVGVPAARDLDCPEVGQASGPGGRGSLQEVALPGRDQRVLWVDGEGAALAAAAAALHDRGLHGGLALTGPGGATCTLAPPPGGPQVRFRPQQLAVWALVGIVVLLILLVAGWELRLAWRSAR
jgi:hypothetical protein